MNRPLCLQPGQFHVRRNKRAVVFLLNVWTKYVSVAARWCTEREKRNPHTLREGSSNTVITGTALRPAGRAVGHVPHGSGCCTLAYWLLHTLGKVTTQLLQKFHLALSCTDTLSAPTLRMRKVFGSQQAFDRSPVVSLIPVDCQQDLSQLTKHHLSGVIHIPTWVQLLC